MVCFSVEMGIYCVLYELFFEIMCIVYSYSVYLVFYFVVLECEVWLEGYEVLKGFEGIKIYEIMVNCFVFGNLQDIVVFCEMLKLEW